MNTFCDYHFFFFFLAWHDEQLLSLLPTNVCSLQTLTFAIASTPINERHKPVHLKCRTHTLHLSGLATNSPVSVISTLSPLVFAYFRADSSTRFPVERSRKRVVIERSDNTCRKGPHSLDAILGLVFWQLLAQFFGCYKRPVAC